MRMTRLRVTDRAGNTTTTNFNVTLDYTTATNPPVVTLIWPQDGMAVSGTNCTLRGTMSDETGTIVAQVVNGDGTTNVITGLVERNHMFWLENVPLNGTNHVTLQATDAAGNVTVTNFTVKPSSLILTIISTPTGDDLYKPAGSVSGTVGDAGATVTVNGMTATVYPTANADSTYDWSADAVPNNGKGTATFDASAAAANGQATAVNSSVELGPYCEIVEHKCDKTEIVNASNDDVISFSTNVWKKLYLTINSPKYVGNLLDYFQGIAGLHNTTYSTNRNGTNYLSSSQFDYRWTYWEAATHATDSSGSNYYSPYIEQTWSQVTSVPDKNALALATGGGPPPWGYHYFGENVHYHWHQHNPGFGTSYKEVDDVFTLTARTTVKLFTGGKAKVTRQSLFRLDCGATKYGQTATGWSDVDMDKSGLRVMNKPVGADGMLWVALADNSDADITVVAVASHYNAWATPTKYHLYIGLTTSTANANLDTDTPEVCVGQLVTLGADWQGGIPPYNNVDNMWWHLPAKYVNEPYQYSSNCTSYRQNTELLTNTAVQCWYINLPGGDCSVRETLHFSNGQSVNIAAAGNFTVYRPTVYFTPDGGAQVILDTNGMPNIYLGIGVKGNNSNKGEMGWKNTVNLNPKYPASIYYTQLIYRDWTWDRKVWWGHVPKSDWPGDYLLDTEVKFAGATIIGNSHHQTQLGLDYGDGPSLVDPLYSFADCQDTFETYLEFQPIGGIPITLGIIDWSWHGRVDGSYSTSSWSLTTNSITGPSFDKYSDNFQEWPDVYHNTGGN